MSWNGFGFNSGDEECNCPECRGVNQELEHVEIDVEIRNPEELLEEYFEAIKNVNSEEELYALLLEFLGEVTANAQKEVHLDEVESKMALIQALEYGE